MTYTFSSPSNSRTILWVRHISSPLIPRLTRVLKDLHLPRLNRNRLLTLDKLQRKTLTRMPRDVAVQDPGPRIIQAKSNREMALCG